MLPAVKNERRSLLVAEVTSSNCSTPSSSGDEEDSREPLEHCTHGRNKQFSKYHYRVLHVRNSSQCNVRRLVRLLPFKLLVPFLVLMLYLPLYSSVQTRQAALSDASDRLQKRIKHLEDYIIALKEEMAQTEARGQLCKCSNIRATSHPGQAAEQTILKLRAIVEKLRSENKYLKDGRRSCESRSSAETFKLDNSMVSMSIT